MFADLGTAERSLVSSRVHEQMTLTDAPDPGVDYGEVFTRHWIVEMILDLVGYTPDRDLASQVIVEPSCGTGAFLLPIADRLVRSAQLHGHDLRTLRGAIQAFDLLDANAERARKALTLRLAEEGLSERDADEIARGWVTTADFLLHDHAVQSANYVVGNPPYIRLEGLPASTMNAYRRACSTMRGRSDVYVGFIERGLALLKTEGALGFICADRWMRNQYGSELRQLIGRSFAVDTVITMHDVKAFEVDVSAYPAVVVIRNTDQAEVVMVGTKASFDEEAATKLSSWIRSRRRRTLKTESVDAARLDAWSTGRDLWPTGSPAQLTVVRDLETRFPPLQDSTTGTRVGIGVATGCDEVFITTDPNLVEADRLLPLLTPSDTAMGSVNWSGSYLVNPWTNEGLVDLQQFPRLREYLRRNQARLRSRHVARQRPEQWYRTIDRVHPDLARRPKLVQPDLKAAAHPVLDTGGFYPHHNLYVVTSEAWDLEVLGGLLLSDVANLFVGAYCVKMRGGCYRFQAQYIRRIRVPAPQSLSVELQRELVRAFADRDREAATAAALQVYGLTTLPR